MPIDRLRGTRWEAVIQHIPGTNGCVFAAKSAIWLNIWRSSSAIESKASGTPSFRGAGAVTSQLCSWPWQRAEMGQEPSSTTSYIGPNPTHLFFAQALPGIAAPSSAISSRNRMRKRAVNASGNQKRLSASASRLQEIRSSSCRRSPK